MNREIKFRAWNGKYMLDPTYGDWISFDGVPYTESERKHNTPNIEISRNQSKTLILMQFTGLKDKNGKEIYEGDILNVNSSRQSVGYYKSGFVTMCIQKTDKGFCEWRKDLSQQYKPEVIGNIHENPELLHA